MKNLENFQEHKMQKSDQAKHFTLQENKYSPKALLGLATFGIV